MGDDEEPKAEDEGKVEDTTAADTKTTEANGKAEADPMDTSEDKPSEEKTGEEKAAEGDTNDAKPEDKKEEANDAPKPKKSKVRREELKVASAVSGDLTDTVMKSFLDKEVSMSNQDRVIAETNEARNAL